MSSRSARLAGLILAVLLGPAVARAEWEPPKDGAITEKQLAAYLKIQKEAIDNWKAAGKAVEGSSSAAAMAVYLHTNAKFTASLAAGGLSEAEYNWIANKAWEAYSNLLLDRVMNEARTALTERRKASEEKLAELKQDLTVYEKAQAEGRRVLSGEEREQAVSQARDDQKAALEEAAQDAQESKQAQDDDTRADAKKAETEARAKAALAEKRISDPDLPVNDEDRIEIKKANAEQIASIKTDIESEQQTLKTLDETMQSYGKTTQDQKDRNPVPQANIDLLKKHRAEFETVWEIGSGNK